MNLITRDHLDRWADTPDAKSTFPYLISRLVRASTPGDTKINIPWGSASYIGGWDGVVQCGIETRYIPRGTSLWEFGTSKNCLQKANDDYEKRKSEPLGFDPKEVTFVFVTPRTWTKKGDWVEMKRDEGHWKNVIVYDGVDLEQWLDEAPAVSRYFGIQAGAYPEDGMITAEEFWSEWSISRKLTLQPECVVAGRGAEKGKLLAALDQEAALIGVKASTKREAIAFIAAAASTAPTGRPLSRTLIINTEDNFRSILTNADPLILIAQFDNPDPLYRAIENGHHVLVPLGADDEFNMESIVLPAVDRNELVQSLIASGLTSDEAYMYTRESGLDLTSLRRLLAFPAYGAEWMSTQNVREIIPALLVGRWNEGYPGDTELLERLSEKNYKDYQEVLYPWLHLPNAPLKQIGRKWRLTSPLDLWSSLSSRLTKKDLEVFQECFQLAYESENSHINAEADKGLLSTSSSQERRYSYWIREGLAQSLILISEIGKDKSHHIGDAQRWVDAIIEKLLYNADESVWLSVHKELPLLAEASPRSFLNVVRDSLSSPNPAIMRLFKEEEGFWSKRSHHLELLRALEGLAWLPEYLQESSSILLTLAKLDPGGSLDNRPMNSLVNIFHPWIYQTLGSCSEKINTLKSLVDQDLEVSWDLLVKLFPHSEVVSNLTYRMRWRMFKENTAPWYDPQEIATMFSELTDMLVSRYPIDDKRLSELVAAAARKEIGSQNRDRILRRCLEVAGGISQKEHQAWNRLRAILSRHRLYADTDWALTEEELAPFQELYTKLQPEDVIERSICLFNDQFPTMVVPPSRTMDPLKQSQERVAQIKLAREEAARELINQVGLANTIELRKQVKRPRTLGETLAAVLTSSDDIQRIYECLEDDDSLIEFTHGFIYERPEHRDLQQLQILVQDLQKVGLSTRAIANALVGGPQNKELWNYIDTLSEEIQQEFWRRIRPLCVLILDGDLVSYIGKLVQHRRFYSAIDVAWLGLDHLPSKLIIDLLRQAATKEASEPGRIDQATIGMLFRALNKRQDVEPSTMLELEILYLEQLMYKGAGIGAPHIEDELAHNPESFVQLLEWLYLPKDPSLEEKESEGLSEEQRQNAAHRAYLVLKAWTKIPGMREDKSIDEDRLWAWVEEVRSLAKHRNRIEVADAEIGRILARYPMDSIDRTEEAIFHTIERINTEDIKRGYLIELFNQQGATIRGVFDGGAIERQRAESFGSLAQKTRRAYPNVSKIYQDLENRYLREAHRKDEEAEVAKLDG